MRKLDGLAWAFLLSLMVLVAIKFSWFKDQYVFAGHWIGEGYHWSVNHHCESVAIGVAFCFGFLFGWGRNAISKYNAERAVKNLSQAYRIQTSTIETLEATISGLQQQLTISGLQRQPENQNEQAPTPAPPKAKSSRKTKKTDSPPPPTPRSWQERLLDGDLDPLDGTTEAKEAEGSNVPHPGA